MNITKAEADVLKYEERKLSLKKLLCSCTNDRILSLSTEEDLLTFVDGACGFIRRVESAACMNEGLKNKKVAGASRIAKGLLRRIQLMQGRANALSAKTKLEKAGKGFLIAKLEWAEKILTQSIPSWGY